MWNTNQVEETQQSDRQSYSSNHKAGAKAKFATDRSSPPEVVLRKSVLKICSKFKGEHPWRSAISKKLPFNFIEITFRHVCSPVNLLHIFRTPFPKNTSGRLLLNWKRFKQKFQSLKLSRVLFFSFLPNTNLQLEFRSGV